MRLVWKTLQAFNKDLKGTISCGPRFLFVGFGPECASRMYLASARERQDRTLGTWRTMAAGNGLLDVLPLLILAQGRYAMPS